ncbi:flagellar brake protein [Calditerrivibrio sp.]|uniref:flagellar brake protein n=1 Tax=Calditerrivibrio sp. TaxID=2792612 RepID=UPI003D09FD8B
MEKIKDYKNILQINTKINVGVSKGDYAGIYDSRIEDITQKHILISLPTMKGVPFPIRPGTEVDISFISNEGRFSFSSVVEGRVAEGIILLQIKKPEYIYRSELRKYFRVETRIKTKINKIFFDKQNGDILARLYSYDVMIKDISGGGVRIVSEIQFEEGDIFIFDLTEIFPGVNEIFGSIVKEYSRLEKKFEYGVEFIMIKERDRDQIIKYVFKRQIENKKLS